MRTDEEPPIGSPVVVRNGDLRPPRIGFVRDEHAGDCPALLLDDGSVLLLAGSSPFQVGLGLAEAALDTIELMDATVLKEVTEHLRVLLGQCQRLIDEGRVRPTAYPERMQ